MPTEKLLLASWFYSTWSFLLVLEMVLQRWLRTSESDLYAVLRGFTYCDLSSSNEDNKILFFIWLTEFHTWCNTIICKIIQFKFFIVRILYYPLEKNCEGWLLILSIGDDYSYYTSFDKYLVSGYKIQQIH